MAKQTPIIAPPAETSAAPSPDVPVELLQKLAEPIRAEAVYHPDGGVPATEVGGEKDYMLRLEQELRSIESDLGRLAVRKQQILAELSPLQSEYRRPMTEAEQSFLLKQSFESRFKERLAKRQYLQQLAVQGITPGIFNVGPKVNRQGQSRRRLSRYE